MSQSVRAIAGVDIDDEHIVRVRWLLFEPKELRKEIEDKVIQSTRFGG